MSRTIVRPAAAAALALAGATLMSTPAGAQPSAAQPSAVRAATITRAANTGTPGAAVPGAAVPVVAHPAWSRRAVVYEVNVRQYTPEGTFAAFQRHLPRLKALGVDALWIMPVQPIGEKNRKGRLGSPYSVRDYRAVNPEFGTKADFVRLVDAAHRQGLKVILDWVPNHTAFDHVWVAPHPDWYMHHPDGTIMNARDNDDHETDWTDVAELNYDNPAMRRAMIADMRYWLDTMKVDGFRCDVAGGVPEDFWRDARATLGAGRPGFFMLAEAEGPKYYDAFDMTYGWSFWDQLAVVAKGKRPVASFDAYFAHADSTLPADGYQMDFTTNHDKNSWDGTEFEVMGADAMPSYVLAATVARSVPMLYSGQEVSNKKRLRFFERDTIDWKGQSLAPFYRRVFDLKHSQAALESGAAGGPQRKLVTSDSAHVYAFTRTKGTNTVLVAVNYGDADATVNYQGLDAAGGYTDWFGGKRSTLGASGTLDVPAHGYRVLVRR
ncbi:alpha-amylase [Gemmatimonadetes bacterium T265]|nr:alpha-amylase [Gemmatimonadetes bacterium T265]